MTTTFPLPLRSLAILACLLGALVMVAHCQVTVNATAGPGERNITDSSGLPLSSGCRVSVGFFDAGFNVDLHASDIPALRSAWNEIGGAYTRTIFGQPGRLGATWTTWDAEAGSKPAWWWISTGQEQGLFSSGDPAWLLPAADAPPPFNYAMLNSLQVDRAAFGTISGSSLGLAPVPEPTTWALIIFAFTAGTVSLARKLRRSARRYRTKVQVRCRVREYF